MKRKVTMLDVLDFLNEMLVDKNLDDGQKELVREATERLDQVYAEGAVEYDLDLTDEEDDFEYGVPV